MASKTVTIPNIGEVQLTKRRGNTNIRMSFARDGSVRVSLPFWLPPDLRRRNADAQRAREATIPQQQALGHIAVPPMPRMPQEVVDPQTPPQLI